MNWNEKQPASPHIMDLILSWQAASIAWAIKLDCGPQDAAVLARESLGFGMEINQSVLGNSDPHQAITIGDVRSIYEATLLWCLRHLGRPEVASVEG